MLRLLPVLLLLCAGPVSAASPDSTEASGLLPNVLLITVDTLRADHVSCYGYHLKTSPNMDRLASEGVRFDRAYTAVPLTGPSHFSILTGRYPQEHGARINGVAHRKDARLLFLPQILRRFGYRNAAFVSGWPLTDRLTHLAQWFDHYDEDLNRTYQLFNSSRYAEDVTPRALRWLGTNQDRPFFLWVHYFDPHSPYHLREEFADLEQTGHPPHEPPDLNEETLERITRYDSEIAYADHYIGKLLATVDALKLRDSTMVVLASDHGESLGEHDYVGHGQHLYEDIVHVPVMFRYPGVVKAGKVVDDQVSLLDLAATIVELTVEGADGGAQLPIALGGRSLAPVLNGEGALAEQPARYVTFAGKKGFLPRWFSFLWVNTAGMPLQAGYTSGSRKVIWAPKERSLEIYDVGKDPFELSPVTADASKSQYNLETARLRRWFESTDKGASKAKMSKRDIEVLKSLGYIQ